MAEHDVRHIAVEFQGGPLDGWSSGQMTNTNVIFPEALICVHVAGRYVFTIRRPGHYVYRWNEGARAEA